MRNRTLGLIAGLLVAAGWAQTAPAGSNTAAINAQNANNYCRIYFVTPKAGQTQQYEAGRKKHAQFHRTQKDTFTYEAWAVETGRNAGSYVYATCNHALKDFDEWEARMGKADTADAAMTMDPYTQSGSNGIYVYRADMSLRPPNQPPTPMVQVAVYELHPGAAPDFIAAIKKTNDALSKQADWPKISGWLQLVNGGEAPTFVLLTSRKNWSEFAPLPKTVNDVMTEVYGKEQADAIQKTIRDCTDKLYTEAATYRADLSYIPGK
jgi:hypothetical protein